MDEADQAMMQGGGGFTANNFFQNVIGLLVIGVFSLAYKLIFRTKWVKLEEADCVTGRKVLEADEIAMLDAYYRIPKWRRALRYLIIA
jgi:yeast amino acid transporter